MADMRWVMNDGQTINHKSINHHLCYESSESLSALTGVIIPVLVLDNRSKQNSIKAAAT